MQRLWFQLGRFGGAPIRIHATFFVGFLFVTGMRFDAYSLLGYVLVVLVHELGHAVAVRVAKGELVGIELHALGGVCHHRRVRSELASIGIAWAGVLAQMSLWIVTYAAVLASAKLPTSLLNMLLSWNLTVAVLNLLPFPNLDGAAAWRIVPYLRRRTTKRAPVPRRGQKASALPRVAPQPQPRRTAGSEPEHSALDDELRRVLERAKHDALKAGSRDRS
jgi:stage IV sporulation protein FB